MKRKIIFSILCLLVLMGVSGCGSKDKFLGTWKTEDKEQTIELYEDNLCRVKDEVFNDLLTAIDKDVDTSRTTKDCEYRMYGNDIEIDYVVVAGKKEYPQKTLKGTFSEDYSTLTINNKSVYKKEK